MSTGNTRVKGTDQWWTVVTEGQWPKQNTETGRGLPERCTQSMSHMHDPSRPGECLTSYCVSFTNLSDLWNANYKMGIKSSSWVTVRHECIKSSAWHRDSTNVRDSGYWVLAPPSQMDAVTSWNIQECKRWRHPKIQPSRKSLKQRGRLNLD